MGSLPGELEGLKRFHTHLGPYVVLGYRMGILAKGMMGGKMKAIVYTAKKTPMSCMIDGIQYGSGCTLGKMNIEVRLSEKQMVRFIGEDKVLLIVLKYAVREHLNKVMTWENGEDLALFYYEEPEEEIFVISEVDQSRSDRLLKL